MYVYLPCICCEYQSPEPLLLSDEDIFWNDREEETLEKLDIRIEKFKNWLKNREEENMIVFGHASFISRFLGNIEKDDDIKHCYPYFIFWDHGRIDLCWN